MVCHMLTSLDGKIDGAYMKAPECGSALSEYSRLRKFFDCKATLYGTTTMAGSFSDGVAGRLPAADADYPKEDYIAASDAESYVVSIDPKGILGWKSNTIQRENRQQAHVIEVLTEAVSKDYLAYLRSLNISFLFAGKEQLDCRLLLEKLYSLFSIERLMIAGGGMMNWSFVQEDLLDELSLVIAPVADGSTETVSIFEKQDFLPERKPAAFQLKEAAPLEGSCLWLRYTR